MTKYLTIEQTKNLINNRPTGVKPEEILNGLKSRGYIIQGLNDQEEEKISTPQERILKFTGGEKIAKGLGQAIAQPVISKKIQETQKQQMDIQGKLLSKIKDLTMITF